MDLSKNPGSYLPANDRPPYDPNFKFKPREVKQPVRLKIKYGTTEVNYEGSEEFLTEHLDEILNKVVRMGCAPEAAEAQAFSPAPTSPAEPPVQFQRPLKPRVLIRKPAPPEPDSMSELEPAPLPQTPALEPLPLMEPLPAPEIEEASELIQTLEAAARMEIGNGEFIAPTANAKGMHRPFVTAFRSAVSAAPPQIRREAAPPVAPPKRAPSIELIAAKLDCNTGSDLILAAAAKLAVIDRMNNFSRHDMMAEMREAGRFFKASYINNFTGYVKGLVKSGKMQSLGTDSFALTESSARELEQKLTE